MIGMLAQSFGIPPQVASLATGAVTKMFLQRSTPQAASGLLSALSKTLTDQFNDNDKQQLTTTQTKIEHSDLIRKLSEITNIKEIDKLDSLADMVLDNIKQNSKIDASDGIDKEELFTAMKDLYSARHSK